MPGTAVIPGTQRRGRRGSPGAPRLCNLWEPPGRPWCMISVLSPFSHGAGIMGLVLGVRDLRLRKVKGFVQDYMRQVQSSEPRSYFQGCTQLAPMSISPHRFQ